MTFCLGVCIFLFPFFFMMCRDGTGLITAGTAECLHMLNSHELRVNILLVWTC